VSTGLNGVGLRDRLAVTADGTHVVFVYGDGRYGSGGVNRTAVYGARITVTVPPPAPALTPDPTPTPDPAPTPTPASG
jgi:hypothetical protein